MLVATQRVALRARGVFRFWAATSCSSTSFSSISERRQFTIARTQSLSYRFAANNNTHIRTLHSSAPLQKIVAFTLSDPGEGIREVVIKQWFVKVGDSVSQFAPVCDVESDKATTTITSRYDGVIHKLHYAVEQTAIVGTALVDIEIEGESAGSDKAPKAADKQDQKSSIKATEPQQEEHEEQSRVPDGKVLATPAVRRFAAEHGIRISEVRGSGKNGRVMREDILTFVAEREKGSVATAQPAAPAAVQPQKAAPTGTTSAAAALHAAVAAGSVQLSTHAQTLLGPDRTEPLRGGVRKAMFKSMTQSLAVPSFTYMDDVDVTRLLTTVRRLRAQLGGGTGSNVPKLTPLAFFVKAVSLALQAFPQLNASVASAEQLTYKAAHNIGVAIDSPSGLLVPNIKHCQLRSVLEIASEIQRLQAAALQGRVGASDLTGGTVTLSNVGAIGGLYTVPIMMPGELLIAGIGRVRDQLLLADSDDQSGSRNRQSGQPGFMDADSGEPIRVRRANVMSVSWSADHRVVDGATVARFCNLWKSYLESPDAMLLNLK